MSSGAFRQPGRARYGATNAASCGDGHTAIAGRHRPLREMRPVPAALPHLSGQPRGRRLAARPDYPVAGAGARPTGAVGAWRLAPAQLPELQCLRTGVPGQSALSQADRPRSHAEPGCNPAAREDAGPCRRAAPDRQHDLDTACPEAAAIGARSGLLRQPPLAGPAERPGRGFTTAADQCSARCSRQRAAVRRLYRQQPGPRANCGSFRACSIQIVLSIRRRPPAWASILARSGIAGGLSVRPRSISLR